jgi:hypothetical protein
MDIGMDKKKYTIHDKWLLIVGIPLVGIIMPFLFNGFSLEFLFSEGYRNLLMSLFTTIAIWLGIRKIVLWLWYKFPWEIHPVKHLVYEVIMVTCYTTLVGFLTYLFYISTGFVAYDDSIPLGISIAVTLLITYFITSLHEAWFFFKQWNISLLKAKTLEKENLQSQYETLKSQVNPHFLFNTLNTLTSLIEEEPKVAVAYVQKTADFLRSILGLNDQEVISLKDEIGIIETFYHLQKERYGDNLMLSISLSPDIMSLKVAPLSLQMLVENAIKHNIISSEKPLHIEIGDYKEGFVSVKNNLQEKRQTEHSNGIGLANIKNRYRFLSDREVEVHETAGEFEVSLPLLDLQ